MFWYIFTFSKVRTSNFDRDILNDSYTISIIAIDSGNPRLEDTLQVQVNIVDVNDKTPVFTDDEMFETLFVDEDSEIDGGSRTEGKNI